MHNRASDIVGISGVKSPETVAEIIVINYSFIITSLENWIYLVITDPIKNVFEEEKNCKYGGKLPFQ